MYNYQHIRACARELFGQQAAIISDHELAKFMPHMFSVNLPDSYEQKYTNTAHAYLGDGAWIADIEVAAAYSNKLKKIIDQVFKNIANYSALEQLFLAHINAAFVIYISRNAKIAQKIMYPIINSMQLALIIIEDGAEVTIEYSADNSFKINMAMQYWFIGSGARVHVQKKQVNNSASVINSFEHWHLKKHAYVTIEHSILITQHDISYFNSVNYYLNGKYAQIKHVMHGAANSRGRIALITKQMHKKNNTTSSLDIKHMLTGNAKLFYRGTIIIGKSATQSVASQLQRTILLADSARSCAIPALEVKNNEVSCRHGTASGTLNQEHIWYLCSRGLSSQQAKLLIGQSFLNLLEPNLLEDIIKESK